MSIFSDYIKLCRKEHLRIEIGISLVVGITVTFILWLIGADSTYLVRITSSTSVLIVTAFSILAGFSTTSLTILATSQSRVIKRLKEELIGKTNVRKIEQIYAYFAWSVATQLLLLLMSVVGSLFLTEGAPWLEELTRVPFVLRSLLTAQVVSITYCITLTLRNISLLHLFLKADAKNED